MEAKYISQTMDECRKELRQESMDVKANAVSKLCYMHMLGYDIGWAAFHIVEVMSSKKFTHKRIGYLAGSQSFTPETDVLMLTTNMIKKDIGDQNQYIIGTAISGLAQFATTDLSRDLAHDLVVLTTSSRPYVRKKATLVLYKIFLQFPDALRPAFPRLKDKLDDAESSVQSCSVNVICELARKNPKNYLSLAPIFFRLLTSSQNNWMRIKIIKLFAALTPLEPRLAKKLIEPLTALIHQTPAMSLLYECIITVIISVPDHLPSIQLCVTKLRIFIEDQDQNLKYLGLQAMAEILKIHPKAVATHKDLIISCLDDGDESIRVRALALIGGMCTKKNLDEIVLKLMKHLETAEGQQYRDEVLKKIVDICYQGNYQYVTDFSWYLSVLIRLTQVDGTKHGKLLASQMMDVTIRVSVVRKFAVTQLRALLSNDSLLNMKVEKNGVCEVLYAAAYVCGEFAALLEDPEKTIEALLVKDVSNLPGHIQAVFIQNMLKIYSHVASQVKPDDEEAETNLNTLRETILDKLPIFTVSGDLEVQERAIGAVAVISYVNKQRGKGINIDAEIAQLFEGDLNPVAPKAQKKVPVPEGLDLDKWINKKPVIQDFSNDGDMFNWMDTIQVDNSLFDAKTEDDPFLLERQKESRIAATEANPFHLGMGALSPKEKFETASKGEDDVADIPVQTLDLNMGAIVVGPLKQKKKKLTKKEKKKLLKAGLPLPEEEEEAPIVVATVMDMPEGAEDTDDDDRPDSDPFKALDINLDAPLDDGEILPVAQHHVAKNLTAEEAANLEKKKAREARRAAKGKKKKKDKDQDGGDGTPEKKEKKAKKEKKEKKDKKDKKASPEPVVVSPLEDLPEPEPVAADQSALDDFLSDGPATSKKAKKAKKDKKDKKAKKEKKENVDEAQVDADEGQAAGAVDGAEVAVAVAEEGEAAAPAEAATDTMVPSVPAPRVFAPSVYKEGGSNEELQVSYDSLVSTSSPAKVQVSLLIKNNSEKTISNIELKIADSDNAKLERESPEDPLKVPFEVEAGKGGDYRLTVSVENILSAQTLDVSVTYDLGADDEKTSGSMDFNLPLPVTTYTYPAVISKEDFEGLLTGDSLTEKSSVSLSNKGGSFDVVVATICATLHLSVMELMDGATSLYGVNTNDKPLCFLLKMAEGSETFSLDGKSSDGEFLAAILDELKEAMA